MAQSHRVFLFGDQTFDLEPSFWPLLRCNDPLVVHFFTQAYHAIRCEVGSLPAHLRDTIPKFTSIADLLSRKRDGLTHPAVEQALYVVHSLGLFIKRHSTSGDPYPSAQDSHVLGICTGSLAAAAVSASRNLLELVPAAIETVRVAFHLGIRAYEVAASFNGSQYSGCWSMVVASLTKESASIKIEDFAKSRPLPLASRLFISAHAAMSVTISGTPEALASFREWASISGCAYLPIYAPYHAPHLFNENDVAMVLDRLQETPANSAAPEMPVLSCGLGQLVWGDSLRQLLEQAVRDVLLRPIGWEKAAESLATILGSQRLDAVQLVPLATTAGETFRRHIGQSLAAVQSLTSVEVLSASIEGTNEPKPTAHGGRCKLAVIGMGGRFPGANSPEALWELLMQGKDMCAEVPPLRWNWETHVDETLKKTNTSRVKWGCWVDDPDLFDAKFFSMSPREAPQVDPAQRLALLTAYEAIEQAGIVPGRTPSTREDRVGVFFGTTSNDWCEANSAQNVDTYYIPGANRAFIPGRINYFFKFSGPSYSVDTACSSSLSALHIACNSLWRGDVDTAIAGGTNVLTNPIMHAGLDRGHFLSAKGNCRTFDADADGYCRGEGVATIVVKRLEDALTDDDPILGVISGAFTNHSAEEESITRPHVGAQKDIFERVLNDSGTSPYEVGYIEMHGTGTQAGDSREMQSVSDVFSPEDAVKKRTAEQKLHLGALKSNIGHGEAVSGVSALIKVIHMMQKQTIPPHCGIKGTINPKFPANLAERQIHIALETTEWKSQPGVPRKAIINNFSAAGGNSCILVEEPQEWRLCEQTNGPLDPTWRGARSCFPVAVTARSPKSLKMNVQAMIKFLSDPHSGHLDLSRLSYTTTARRMHHQHRVLVCGSTTDEISVALQSALAQDTGSKRCVAPRGRLFAFTGQGAQYPGMARQLLEHHNVFRVTLHHFDSLAQNLGFPSMLPLFTETSGNNIVDYSPAVVQLANICMQIALAKIWMSWGVTPTAVVGHSLGEYAALNIAGVLSDVDTIYMVGSRATLLEQKCQRGSHAMLAVLTSLSNAQQVASGFQFEVACVNGPEEVVLAGTVEVITKLQQHFTRAAVKCTLLKVPYAFHSAQLDLVKDDIKQAAAACTFRAPQIPVLSPLLGSVVKEEGVFCADYLARHAREPVNFMQSLMTAAQESVIGDQTYAIEFGPHPVVSGMIKSNLGSKLTTLSTLRRNKDCWETLTESLAALYMGGMSIRWDEYFRELPAARKVIELPKYCWDLQSYWIHYKDDFLLTCGNASAGVAKVPTTPATIQAAPQPLVPAEPAPTLESTSIHRVVKEVNTATTLELIVETDVTRSDIMPMMEGHTVDGVGLCTPSVYADITFTIGNYILKKFKPPGPATIVDVGDMEIDKALIPASRKNHFLHTCVKLDWAAKYAKVIYKTVNEEGVDLVTHATGGLSFKTDEHLRALQGPPITTAMTRYAEMRQDCLTGSTYRFSSDMAYNMISSLAEFHKDYRCIDETIYNHSTWEASATVSFGQMKQGGVFHTHPGAIDGFTQSAGFVMNANETTDLDKDIFVNHGWDSFQLYEPVRHDCSYSTHVKMVPVGKGQWKGDIIVWSEGRVVASIRGCCSQHVPRRVMKYILSTSGGAVKNKGGVAKAGPAPRAAASAAPAPKTAPKQQSTPPVPQAQFQPPPAQTIAVAQPVAAPSRVPAALAIIAEQSGVPLAELQDDSVLADIGVDSLLTLTITGAFADEFGIEPDTTFFDEHPTIADVSRFFSTNGAEEQAPIATWPAVQPAVAPAQLYSQPNYAPPPPQTVSMVQQAAPLQAFAAPPQPIQTSGPSATHQQLLSILAEESGLAPEDLTDDMNLLDAGVDSLLSLVIGGRLREAMNLDLDVETLISTCETVGDLKRSVGVEDSTPAAVEVVPNPVPAWSPPPVPQQVQYAAPLPVATVQQTMRVETVEPPATPPMLQYDDTYSRALEILCEETQIAPEDFTEDTNLTDVGVDSLLSLVVTSRFRDELDLELQDDDFASFGTLKVMKEWMMSRESTREGTPSTSSTYSSSASFDGKISRTSTTFTPFSEIEQFALPEFQAPKPRAISPATSVVLQGTTKTAMRQLHLFPDGSGSATSYISLPRVAPDLIVYGLNSPFIKDASQMSHCSFDDLCHVFLTEVRRRQPVGPYDFAGWSAGGALAFRSAQILLAQGETITSLTLIDAPIPKGLGELPQRLYDYLSSFGTFASRNSSDKAPPEWLIPHFKAMTKALHTYHASPMPYGAIPKVHILWAGRSVIDSVGAAPFQREPGDSPDVAFLTETRKDFGPGGWAELVPGSRLWTGKVEGADHFEMMRFQWAQQVSDCIAKALSA